MLDRFSVTLAVFTAWQAVEGEGVNDHQAWLVKCTDQVFAFRCIDAGFSTR